LIDEGSCAQPSMLAYGNPINGFATAPSGVPRDVGSAAKVLEG
jgi:hypothetical protein